MILLDNASCHNTIMLKSWAMENNIILLFNIPYFSKSNPVELFFSDIKTRCNGLNT